MTNKMRKLYFAPMEGITGYIFRNTFHEFFSGADKYYTPFLAPNQNACLKTRELQDILPEHNRGLTVVPQILTNKAEHFIQTAHICKQFGYEEINLNLGCPSATVVTKKKGAGLLADLVELEHFLEAIFSNPIIRISIKTRIGIDSPEEFEEILKIFNKYPICELIIHPRVQKELYKNKPNLDIAYFGIKESRHPCCYNGDICTVSDYQMILEKLPDSSAVMIGRGLLMNPGLLGEIRKEGPASKEAIFSFHNRLCEEYRKVLSGDRDVLFKMKEIWLYLSKNFPESEKILKKIRKTKTLCEYQAFIQQVFYS